MTSLLGRHVVENFRFQTLIDWWGSSIFGTLHTIQYLYGWSFALNVAYKYKQNIFVACKFNFIKFNTILQTRKITSNCTLTAKLWATMVYWTVYSQRSFHGGSPKATFQWRVFPQRRQIFSFFFKWEGSIINKQQLALHNLTIMKFIWFFPRGWRPAAGGGHTSRRRGLICSA